MKSTIERFYKAFQALDAEEMASCYHEDIQFQDPAFGILNKEKARNMWRMLCQSQKDKNFKLTYNDISYENGEGKARWEAHYIFSKTGRPVRNIIHATFTFKDEKIISHQDHFDLYRWARQALGMSGYFIGWTPYFQKKLQQQTNSLLNKFENKKG